MALALFVLALILSVSIPIASTFLNHEQLRADAMELRTMARTAQREALFRRQRVVIALEKTGFRIFAARTPDNTIHSYPLSSSSYEIKFMKSPRWERPSDREWVFEPSGLCDPIEFMFRADNAWIHYKFSPLTANVTEEHAYFP